MSTISAGTSATTALVATGDTTGQLVIETNGATAQTIDSGQRTKFPTTIGVGNATPSTSGSGITFPATQSASSDVNTLDDYEEGDWTPTQGSGLTVVGAFSSSGKYTKIGRQVTITGFVAGATSVSVTSFGVICGGLPFVIGSSVSSGVGWTPNAATSATYISTTSGNLISVEAFTAATIINFTVTYFV